MFNEFLDEDLGLDLTPLIDVIFMLLIFFIMTTTFNKPILDIVLPTAEQVDQLEKGEEIVISLTKEGGFFYKNEQVSLGQLEEIFAEQPEATVNLYVDKETPFDAFVQVIDKAKVREAGKLVISAETP